MEPITKGSRIRCVDNFNAKNELTLDKEYTVVLKQQHVVYIYTDDGGRGEWYAETRFTQQPKNNTMANEQAAVTPAPIVSNDQLNATLAVSNTDIVTMMVVKNRKLLTEKLAKIQEKWACLVTEQADEIVAILEAELAKTRFKEMCDAYLVFAEIALNEKKLLLHTRGISPTQVECFVRDHYQYADQSMAQKRGHYYNQKADPIEGKIKYEVWNICLELVGDSDEANDKIDSRLQNQEVPIRITAIIDERPEMREMGKEVQRITLLLRNENSLKEEMVANITEQAILNSPMLSSLTGNIKMIE